MTTAAALVCVCAAKLELMLFSVVVRYSHNKKLAGMHAHKHIVYHSSYIPIASYMV